jgi:signal peptidase II
MARYNRIFLVLILIVSSIACDQYTKMLAKSHLPKAKAFSFVGDTLRFDYNENKGGVFTFEYHLPREWRGKTVTVASYVLLTFIILYLLLIPNLSALPATALSLFCGGSLSNLLDRTLLVDHVIDFLNIGWGAFRTEIFNMADVAISLGLALLTLSILRSPFKPKSSKKLELPPI